MLDDVAKNTDVADLMASAVTLPSARMAMGFAGLFIAVLLVGGLINYLLGKLVESTGSFEGMLRALMDELACVKVEMVGLAPDAGAKYPSELSGGMRKRVALARAVAVRPEIVFYDEPAEGLDPINVTRVNRLLLGLKDSLNVTSVVVTHNLKAAFAISDRLALIHDGTVVATGAPETFLDSQDAVVREFIGERMRKVLRAS